MDFIKKQRLCLTVFEKQKYFSVRSNGFIREEKQLLKRDNSRSYDFGINHTQFSLG